MKRAQASLEFMLTYGWILLLGLTFIGLVAYQIFSADGSQGLAQQQCRATKDFPCLGTGAVGLAPSGSGLILIGLSNGHAEKIFLEELQTRDVRIIKGACADTFSPVNAFYVRADDWQTVPFAIGISNPGIDGFYEFLSGDLITLVLVCDPGTIRNNEPVMVEVDLDYRIGDRQSLRRGVVRSELINPTILTVEGDGTGGPLTGGPDETLIYAVETFMSQFKGGGEVTATSPGNPPVVPIG